MTIQCLCSVPEPRAMIADLYTYLKPGGKWYAYEHVVTHQNVFLTRYQGKSTFVLVEGEFVIVLTGNSRYQHSLATLYGRM